MRIDEAARRLGVELARFRFIEAHCQGFLSASPLDIPRAYCTGDLKILAAADRLLREGLPPASLKARLDKMLAEPSDWSRVLSGPTTHESALASVIAITSGKGGVGKSNIALGLGVELVGSGFRTALMDADLGVANAHLLAGLKTGRTLRDFLSGECAKQM